MMENNGMSPADIAAVMGGGSYGGNSGMWGMEWIFALLLLPAMFRNGGIFGNGSDGGNPVTESMLCNSQNFQNLQNLVGRISDQMQANQQQTTNGICEASYENLRNILGLQQTVAQGDAAIQAQQADCCCQQLRAIDSINFNAAMNTASINANVDAKIQKVLDTICQDKIQALQSRVTSLETAGLIAGLQNNVDSQFCGINNKLATVVTYPNQTTFTAGPNPFFNPGWGNCNCAC